MDKGDILSILKQVESGALTADEAVNRLKILPFEDLGFAKVDHHRAIRQGIAEVIYGAGKTPEQIIKISDSMLSAGQKTILITRLSPEAAEIVSNAHEMTYHEMGHVGIIGKIPEPNGSGSVVVATGGGSVLSDSNRALMKANGFVVCLDARPETIASRLADSSDSAERPMLEGGGALARIVELKSERDPLYALADFIIQTDDMTPDQVTHEVLLAFRERAAVAGGAA
jgi:shikimate kinase